MDNETSKVLLGFLRLIDFKSVFVYFSPVISFFKNWFFILLPIFLWRPFTYFWRFWRTELFLKKESNPILLEIKIPKENLKPIKSMENVFAGIWQAFWDPPNFWEKWWDGKICLGFQVEIISVEGDIHFYFRCPKVRRDIVEANIYSQYPDTEIRVVDDYTKTFLPTVLQTDWDLFGVDYKLAKSNPYPIKTYEDFEPSGETISIEEKRVDPVNALFEALNKITTGEQLWLQFQMTPIAQEWAEPFLNEGKELMNKLAKRPEKPKPKSILSEAFQILVSGPPQKEPAKVEVFPAELRLTEGEKIILKGVERKISKPAFSCSIRFILWYKRGVGQKVKLRLPFSFFGNYATQNLNSLVPLGKTITKIYSRPPFSALDARRTFVRKRRILRRYLERMNPTFPRFENWKFGTFILNVEEIASLIHFPGWRVSPLPAVPRAEAKKGGPPADLPIE